MKQNHHVSHFSLSTILFTCPVSFFKLIYWSLVSLRRPLSTNIRHIPRHLATAWNHVSTLSDTANIPAFRTLTVPRKSISRKNLLLTFRVKNTIPNLNKILIPVQKIAFPFNRLLVLSMNLKKTFLNGDPNQMTGQFLRPLWSSLSRN